MIEYLVFPDLVSAQAKADALSSALGFPHAQTRTAAYAKPIPHPADARALLPVNTRCYSRVLRAETNPKNLLAAGERTALKSRAWVMAEGWFPPSPVRN